MQDRLLTIKEKNYIDSSRKASNGRVQHNFQKAGAIASNSDLANQLFIKLSQSRNKGMFINISQMNPSIMYSSNSPTTWATIDNWLTESCFGLYLLVGYNLFFELPEDCAAFIMRFSEV
jgi:hypothetical protein